MSVEIPTTEWIEKEIVVQRMAWGHGVYMTDVLVHVFCTREEATRHAELLRERVLVLLSRANPTTETP